MNKIEKARYQYNWYRNHKKEMKTYQKRWIEEHKDYQKKWTAANRDHVNDYHRKYYSQHKKKINATTLKWMKKNPDKIKEYNRKQYWNDPQKHTLRAKNYVKRIRMELFELLGSSCKMCGFSDMRALQLDHKYGGGKIDRSMHGSYYKLIKFYSQNKNLAKQKLQVLCANCNWIKIHDNDERFHKY